MIFGKSKYVLDGIQGEAYKWQCNSWCGPKSSVEALLQTIDSISHLIKWMWSPSHQGIPSNEQADEPDERGRCMHHFYLIARSPLPPCCNSKFFAELKCASQPSNHMHSRVGRGRYVLLLGTALQNPINYYIVSGYIVRQLFTICNGL